MGAILASLGAALRARGYYVCAYPARPGVPPEQLAIGWDWEHAYWLVLVKGEFLQAETGWDHPQPLRRWELADPTVDLVAELEQLAQEAYHRR